MSKKIFLTGANGFIGKNIIDKLGKKYKFFAPTHKKLDLLNSDSVTNYFRKNGPFDLVIHTAIVGGNRMTGDGEVYALNSMRMFMNAAAGEKYFKRFFYFGSGIEYGKEKPIKKFKEDYFSKRIPQSNWGLFKYICTEYVQTHKKFVNLRVFGTFGKWEDYRIRFISNAICKNIFKLPIVINRNIRMDYLYIDDLVGIVDAFINKRLRYNAYNLTPANSIDLISIAETINTLSKNTVPVIVKNIGFSPEYTGDNQRLLKEIPNLKFTKMDDAISELFQWYENNQKIIDKRELSKEYF